MNANSQARIGFTYKVEVIRDGVVIDSEEVHNRIPVEGLTYLLAAGVKGGAQISSWYMGIYENNYTPQASDLMATFPGGGYAGESTAYDEVSRVLVALGAAAAGVVASTANALFTMTSALTIYGGFLSSSGAKGSTSGVLVSAVKFASPKVLQAGDVLSVSASLSLTS